jgi:hypothetical protein
VLDGNAENGAKVLTRFIVNAIVPVFVIFMLSFLVVPAGMLPKSSFIMFALKSP